MLDLTNTLFELRSLRHKLTHYTYQAVFGATHADRAEATTAAIALHQTIEGVLAKTWGVAACINQFASSPDSQSRLATLDSFVQLLESIEQNGGNLPVMSTPAPEQLATAGIVGDVGRRMGQAWQAATS